MMLQNVRCIASRASPERERGALCFFLPPTKHLSFYQDNKCDREVIPAISLPISKGLLSSEPSIAFPFHTIAKATFPIPPSLILTVENMTA
jgi:hypothetical protein